MNNTYIQSEAKNAFKNWTNEGWEFLLHSEQHKDIAITTLSKILDAEQSVEFIFNNLYYEIFESSETGYIVNVYSSDEKDEYDCYLDKHNIDGGLCTGSCRDAVEFMM